MLMRIKSVIFSEKTIEFHEGLNVILGDNKGSNSIGKSTLLMILDFIFGGKTYISHNRDVIKNLGDHNFVATFKFNNNEYHYVRGTKNPKVVYRTNKDYEKLEEISISDYTNELKRFYGLESDQFNFREAVSTFSRVWGKNNYNVKKPLHNYPQEKFIKTVTKLIKLFNKYNSIERHEIELKKLEDQKKVLNSAGKYKLIPKINKRKFKKNEKEIQFLLKEIERLGKNVYSPSGDIQEIVSNKMINLREKKKKLIDEREYYISRLNRTKKTIKRTAKAEFESLLEFFPNVNLEKLQNIESFHQGITTILTEELENAKNELLKKINELEKEINIIKTKQEQLLNPNEELNIFIESLIELSSRLKNLQLENQYYNKLSTIKENIKNQKNDLEDLKEKIVTWIKEVINTKLKEMNDLVYEGKMTAPELKLTSSVYEYKFFNNTGTGKAYSNLLIFDLAILLLTKLPFIMHDSFLFKNIEKEAVEKIIKLYNSMSKQVFIAIDTIDMYNKATQKTLLKKKVIQLSNDKLLTTLDWRDSRK